MSLPEHPIATHDGMIWPIPRAEMVDEIAIRTRLAEDVRRLLAGSRWLSLADLVAFGWAEAQLIAHAEALIEAARLAGPHAAPQAPQPDTVPLRPRVGVRSAPGHVARGATIALTLRRIGRELAAVAADLDEATGEAASRGLATVLLVGAVLGIAVVLA